MIIWKQNVINNCPCSTSIASSMCTDYNIKINQVWVKHSKLFIVIIFAWIENQIRSSLFTLYYINIILYITSYYYLDHRVQCLWMVHVFLYCYLLDVLWTFLHNSVVTYQFIFISQADIQMKNPLIILLRTF